jgi:hypothetical protein
LPKTTGVGNVTMPITVITTGKSQRNIKSIRPLLRTMIKGLKRPSGSIA